MTAKLEACPLKKLYIAEYKCGCSADSSKKKELLNYCGKHGHSLTRPIYAIIYDRRAEEGKHGG